MPCKPNHRFQSVLAQSNTAASKQDQVIAVTHKAHRRTLSVNTNHQPQEALSATYCSSETPDSLILLTCIC